MGKFGIFGLVKEIVEGPNGEKLIKHRPPTQEEIEAVERPRRLRRAVSDAKMARTLAREDEQLATERLRHAAPGSREEDHAAEDVKRSAQRRVDAEKAIKKARQDRRRR